MTERLRSASLTRVSGSLSGMFQFEENISLQTVGHQRSMSLWKSAVVKIALFTSLDQKVGDVRGSTTSMRIPAATDSGGGACPEVL